MAYRSALGANNFKHDWFATNINDLTPAALSAHLKHIASPPPLSAAEAALAEVQEAEAAEAKRAALDPQAEARRRQAVVGLSGKFKLGPGVQEALEKVAQRSDDGWMVCLEIDAKDTAAISLLISEACAPGKVASKLPPKSPCYTFYSYPTPPPAPAPAPAPAAAPSSPSAPRNTFQGSQGGVRVVRPSNVLVEAESQEEKKEGDEEPSVDELSIKEPEAAPAPAPEPVKPSKGRVLFIYTCPSGSPVKFRMVYSSGVRGIQQDAMDKAGVEVAGKLETSDIPDLTESYLKDALPSGRPIHSNSLPTPNTTSARTFGAPAPKNDFGGAFGRPRPVVQPVRSATQVPLPPSEPATPGGADEGDGKDSIRKAFDAFGPRVGAGGGGFARPRPAGRR